MLRKSLWSLLLFAVIQLPAQGAQLKSLADNWDDTRDYLTSPLHWNQAQWQLAATSIAVIAASSTLDSSVRDHFAPPNGFTHTNISPTRDALPLAVLLVGTFAAGAVSHDSGLAGTGWDMGEAVVLGTLSSQAFKLVAGRERPKTTAKPGRFGHGGSSFPSGHTTVAFAAAQVLADELPPERWVLRSLAYGLAGATAYARMDSNAHWLSDTVAGAALGMATGRFVSMRVVKRDTGLVMGVKPLHRGAMLTFSLSAP